MGGLIYPKKKYPIEVNRFHRMQSRVKNGYTTTVWPRTIEGFWAFLKCLGPAPKKMKQPSVGRKNHSKGYQPGNCRWEEMAENRLEACLRMGEGNKGRVFSKEHKRKLSESHIGQPSWAKGKTFTKKHKKKLSDARKGRPPWNKGKKATSKTKAKLKASWEENRESRCESLKLAWVKRRLRNG